MKKSKLFWLELILVLALTIAVTLSFAACSVITEPGDNDNDSSANENGSSDNVADTPGNEDNNDVDSDNGNGDNNDVDSENGEEGNNDVNTDNGNQDNNDVTPDNGGNSGDNVENEVYYTITFEYNGFVYETVSVKEGELPQYNGETPTKTSDDEYEFIFDGWGEITAAYEDKTYTASFRQELAAPAWDGNVATSFAGGNGTEADPYQISSAAELAYLAELVAMGNADYNNSNVYYELTDHVNISAKPWLPIGTGFDINGSRTDDTVFKANFNGNKKKIINLKIEEAARSYHDIAGLFGKSYGTIKNAWVVRCKLECSDKSVYLGALCGYSDGIIEDSYVSYANVSGGKVTGSLVGFATTLISCHSRKCTLSPEEETLMGGLAGAVNATSTTALATVRNSSFEGTINCKKYHKKTGWTGYLTAQGFIGEVYDADISDSYVRADLASGCGFTIIKGGVTIERCHATGTMKSSGTGFADIWTYNDCATKSIVITDCYSGFDMTSNDYDVVATAVGFANVTYVNEEVELNIRHSMSYTNVINKYAFAYGFARISTTNKDMIKIDSCAAFGNLDALVGAIQYNGGTSISTTAFSFINKDAESTLINCHRAESQKINSIEHTVYNATPQFNTTLNSADFYTGTLGLDPSVWDLENLNVQNGGYPCLK